MKSPAGSFQKPLQKIKTVDIKAQCVYTHRVDECAIPSPVVETRGRAAPVVVRRGASFFIDDCVACTDREFCASCLAQAMEGR